MKQKDELAFASRALSSIEINGTFYALQKPDSFAKWADAVPEDFVFALKGPRYVTHIRRLREPATLVANFLASGPLRLGAKLGPILWQLPPNFAFDAERIEAFLACLPHDTERAARLAKKHDGALKAPAWTRIDAARPLRHAMEIRHASFACAAFVDLLRAHGVALVCADTVVWPLLGDLTADFVYCRLHGDAELYVGGYDDAALDDWARRVRGWLAGGEAGDLAHVGGAAPRRARDVFVYFDNTTKTRAPLDAQALIGRL